MSQTKILQENYYDITAPYVDSSGVPAITYYPYTMSAFVTPGTFPPDNAIRGEAPDTTRAGFWPCAVLPETGAGAEIGVWRQIEDHRGAEGYIHGEHATIKRVGPLPEGWSEKQPEPELTEADKEAQRREEIIARLEEIDVSSVRPLRAILCDAGADSLGATGGSARSAGANPALPGAAMVEDKARLSALDVEAKMLRLELAALR